MSHEITKAQQVSEEMISVDSELLDEELDTVAGGITINDGVNGGKNSFVEDKRVQYGYGYPRYSPWH